MLSFAAVRRPDNPDSTLAGAQCVGVEVLSVGAQICSWGAYINWRLALAPLSTQSAARSDRVCMLSAFFWGPEQGLFSMKANLCKIS